MSETNFSPREIVSELDRNIVGQKDAKLDERTAGVLVSMSQGSSTFYALDSLRDRGAFFVHPQTEIYDGGSRRAVWDQLVGARVTDARLGAVRAADRLGDLVQDLARTMELPDD